MKCLANSVVGDKHNSHTITSSYASIWLVHYTGSWPASFYIWQSKNIFTVIENVKKYGDLESMFLTAEAADLMSSRV